MPTGFFISKKNQNYMIRVHQRLRQTIR